MENKTSFRLKIVIKNSKPVIWRRILIPCGVTFSTAAFLINETMELPEPREYLFKQTSAKTFFQESAKNSLHSGTSGWEERDAASTCAGDYWKPGTRTVYQTSDGASFSLEVEKTEEGIQLPQLLLLGASSADPLQTAGKTAITDFLNKISQNCSFHYVDTPDYKSLHELYVNRGAKLPVMTDPVSKEGNYWIRTERSDLYDSLAAQKKELEKELQRLKFQLRLLQESESEKPSTLPVYITQKEILLSYSKPDLLQMAKDRKLKCSASWRKEELAEKLANEMLTPSWLRTSLLTLEEPEMNLFRELSSKAAWWKLGKNEKESALKLDAEDLIFVDREDLAAVSVDLRETFKKIDTPEFRRDYKKVNWLLKCFYAVTVMYGMLPFDDFCRLYGSRKHMKLDETEFRRLLDLLPKEAATAVLVDGRLMDSTLYTSGAYRKLERDQAGKPLYMPAPEELDSLFYHKYPADDPHYQMLRLILQEVFKLGDDKVFYILYHIYRSITYGGLPSDLMKIINDEGLVFPDEGAVQKFVTTLFNVMNNTRTVINRGYTPNELRRLSGASDGVPFGASAGGSASASSAPVKKPAKIFPNDPCPCGSGKKYKKCCGKQ